MSVKFITQLVLCAGLLAAAVPFAHAQDAGGGSGGNGGQWQGQGQRRAPLTITSPADGATVSSPVTIIYGSPDANQPLRAGVQVFLLIDQATPQQGDSFTADQNHVAFADGQNSVSVTLASGAHRLQLVTLRNGKVGRRKPTSIAITVQ